MFILLIRGWYHWYSWQWGCFG